MDLGDRSPGQKVFAAIVASLSGTSVDFQLERLPDGEGGGQWDQLARFALLYFTKCHESLNDGTEPPRLVMAVESQGDLHVLDTRPPEEEDGYENFYKDEDWDDGPEE